MISLLVLETSIRVSYRRKWSINRTNQKRKSIAKLEAAAELAKESDTNNDKQETESGKKRVKKMLMVTRTCQTPC